jgi:hypothetical protein
LGFFSAGFDSLLGACGTSSLNSDAIYVPQRSS